MKLAAFEVYPLPFDPRTVRAEYHCVPSLPPRVPFERRELGGSVGVKYVLRANIGDRTIEGWGLTKEKAKREFELTLEKWLSDGAP